jgi:hypothetical protein
MSEIMNETPQIMIIVAIRYCLEERYGDALIHLEKVAEMVNNKKAKEMLSRVDRIIYYGGNMIPYVMQAGHTSKVQINRDGTREFMEKSEFVSKIVEAKKSLVMCLMMLMESTGLEMTSFIDSLNKVRV